MPKAHVVMKTYHTGTSYPEAIFTSKKKAQAYIDEYALMDENAGWTVTKEMENFGAKKVLLTTVSRGDTINTLRFYVHSDEVK
jgi:hypothetical protein